MKENKIPKQKISNLIIFDMDGTLLDTLPYTIDVMNASLEDMGYRRLDEKAYDNLLGASLDVMSERLLDIVHPVHSTSEVIKMKQTISRNAAKWDAFRPVSVFETIKPVIRRLKQQGIQMAVLSNTPHELTCRLCELYLPDCFKAVYGEGEIERKPSARGVERVMRECASDTNHTLLVGDTSVDVHTAENAGIPMIGVTWGCKKKGEWEKEEILEIAEDGSQLQEAIETYFNR